MLDVTGTSYFYPPSSDIPLYHPYWNSSSSDQPIRLWIVLCTIIVYIGYILSLYNFKMCIYRSMFWSSQFGRHIPAILMGWSYQKDRALACQVEKGQRALQETDEAYQCLSSTEPGMSGWVLLESELETMVFTLWLCQNSYWKWLFIVDFPIKNGDFP